jgi:multiple sugar transport system ATP-binding protein
MVTLSLESISKNYGDLKVIDNLNLKVGDREFLVLLGPSGCGKTTTLRCIAGLENIDSGKIVLDGRVVNDVSPRERDIAMVFQNYALYPFMKVKDNLAFPLKLRKTPDDQIQRKVKEVAELLKLMKLLDRKPKQLSGGEQQRVALGRALIRDPKLFLMDEPLSNLDAKLRVETRTEIKRLQREVGITTVFVTHDQAEALALADKIAVLDKGVAQQIGAPNEIYTNPSNTMVAQFIGSPPMNMLAGTFDSSNPDQLLVNVNGSKCAWVRKEARLLSNIEHSDSLIFGFRPEDGSFRTGTAVGNDCIPAEVYVAEPVGPQTILSLKVGDKTIKVYVPSDMPTQIGDKGSVTVKEGKVHIFDEADGKSKTL